MNSSARSVTMLFSFLIVFIPAIAWADHDITLDPESCPYLKAPSSPNYLRATAGDPQYSDAVLWPADSKKSFYAKQKWPQGRRLVWAHPGQSMRSGDNPGNPSNWLENGKPAAEPIDADTDLEFPSAPGDATYFIDFDTSKGAVRRHMTINPGANVSWQHEARGNTWIKRGGILRVLTRIAGDKHAFLRNDNPTSWWMVDHLFCNKATDASIEIIGAFSVDDSYHFNSGMTILAEGSAITPQSRCTLNVQQNASLVLLSGALFRKQANQTFGCDLIVRGKLLGGLPDRPLTRDCTLGLSWKGKRRFLTGEVNGFRTERSDDVALIVMPKFSRNFYADKGGWQNVTDPAATLAVYSANPAKAHFVIAWNGLELGGETQKSGEENFQKLSQVKEKYVEAYLLGDLKLDGVLFNYFGKGGIVANDPAAIVNAKHLTWGKDNAGPPAQIVRKWDGKPQSLMNNPKDF